MFVQNKGLELVGNLVPTLEYFVDRACWPKWSLSATIIPFHDLTWVQSGRATYWCDGIAHQVAAGDLLYLPIGSLRLALTDTDDPMRCLACNFQCTSLEGGNQAVVLPLPTVSHIGFPDELAELYYKLDRAWLERGPAYLLETRGLLMLIIYRLVMMTSPAGKGSGLDARLRLVQQYIVERYTKTITVGQLAAQVKLHPGYFGAWFRRRTGLTVHEYINRIRIRKASDLLATGGYNVSEAAFRSGFDDLFHFSKVYKRVTGRTPSQYLRGIPGGSTPPRVEETDLNL